MFECSDVSGLMTSEAADTAKYTYPPAGHGNFFAFKFEDPKGHVHRLNSGEQLFWGNKPLQELRNHTLFLSFSGILAINHLVH